MKIAAALLAFASAAIAANPYLSLPDEKPVERKFTGTEWGDEVEIPAGKEAAPYAATVTTRRAAVMDWGAIYEIAVKPAPPSKREAESLWFLATDGQILRLNGEDMAKDVAAISAMKKQPAFEKSDVWGLTKGTIKYTEGPWTTEITVKGDTTSRKSWHDGSGHFGTIVWKRGSGLAEYAQGRGAMAEGFRLKAPAAPVVPKKK